MTSASGHKGSSEIRSSAVVTRQAQSNVDGFPTGDINCWAKRMIIHGEETTSGWNLVSDVSVSSKLIAVGE